MKRRNHPFTIDYYILFIFFVLHSLYYIEQGKKKTTTTQQQQHNNNNKTKQVKLNIHICIYSIMMNEYEEELWETIFEFADEWKAVNCDNVDMDIDQMNNEITYVLYLSFPPLFIDYEDLYEIVENVTLIYVDLPELDVSLPFSRSIEEHLSYLRSLPQPEQRTPEWYEFRHKHITASSAWRILKSPATLNSYIYEKCIDEKPHFIKRYGGKEDARDWGVKYEPISVHVYEYLFKTKIGEFGCIEHREHVFLAASPDGINIDPLSEKYGIMLEIKNIVNREITGIPKYEYWVQTQLQMEVCELPTCDFLETRFKEFENDIDFEIYSEHAKITEKVIGEKEDNTKEKEPITKQVIKGIIVVCETVFPEYIKHYEYMPLHCLPNWREWVSTIMAKCEYTYYRTIYWYLDEISCVKIIRDREWFQASLPIFQTAWETITQERITGVEHRKPKPKVDKPHKSFRTDGWNDITPTIKPTIIVIKR